MTLLIEHDPDATDGEGGSAAWSAQLLNADGYPVAPCTAARASARSFTLVGVEAVKQATAGTSERDR